MFRVREQIYVDYVSLLNIEVITADMTHIFHNTILIQHKAVFVIEFHCEASTTGGA